MDAVSYSLAAKQKQRIERVNANPDSDSGVLTVPDTIATGETIVVPAGRIAVLPNVQVDGDLVVEGSVFIPSGSTYTITTVNATEIYQDGNQVANDNAVVHNTGDENVGGVKTFTNSPIAPTPTTGMQVANKDYVDTSIAGVDLTGYLQDVGNSLTSAGYVVLSNGLIIQWGLTGTTTDGSTAVTVTFPIAFPNAVFHVSYMKIGNINGTGTGDDRVGTVTLTTFLANAGTVAGNNYYIALGY